MRPLARPRHRSLGLLVLAFACTHPGASPGVAPSSPARPDPVAPRPTPGLYGPEPVAAPSPLEERALQAVRAELAHRGMKLAPSAALVLAGRELARRAADGEERPLARVHLRGALARALAFDPAPTAHLVVARPEQAVALLASRLSGEERFTHAGVGAEVRGERAYLVLLLVRRKATLRPFPREVGVGTSATLEGELHGLLHPSVHLTLPSGRSRAISLAQGAAGRFSVPIAFEVKGRWLVEVVGEGQGGPEVAALVTVSCGGAGLEEASSDREDAEPADVPGTEARVVGAINATRRSFGLEPLELRPEIAAVARRHSQAMAESHVLAHVLPGSGSVADRLRVARIPYAIVRENVALGASALEAHRAAEESPAHRQNILSQDVTEIGCGVARGTLPSGEPAVYLTEIFLAPTEDGAADRMTPEGRVREVLWHERARSGAPDLISDPALDELAREAALDMVRSDIPARGEEGFTERALGLHRKLAAVDLFVAARPIEAARSTNLPDPRFRRAGVGVAIGDSARYGAGRLFIAVVYTD